jgi:hypothetical protein
VVDDFVWVGRREGAITEPLIRDEQRHFVGDGLTDERLERCSLQGSSC